MSSMLTIPGAGVVSYQASNPEATIWTGNLDSQVTEELLWELFCQVGPIVSLNMPRDRVTSNHEGYAFIEFNSAQTADYALRVMSNVHLFGRIVRINKALKEDRETMEQQKWLAKLFVGGLAPTVDEVLLNSIFSGFGAVLQARVMKDADTGESKGYGFVIFDSFESSDKAIESMDGLMVENRPISVVYANKTGSDTEKHGSDAERLLASKVKRDHIISDDKVSLSKLNQLTGQAFPNQSNILQREDNTAHLADQNILPSQYATQQAPGSENAPSVDQNNNNSNTYQPPSHMPRSTGGYQQHQPRFVQNPMFANTPMFLLPPPPPMLGNQLFAPPPPNTGNQHVPPPPVYGNQHQQFAPPPPVHHGGNQQFAPPPPPRAFVPPPPPPGRTNPPK